MHSWESQRLTGERAIIKALSEWCEISWYNWYGAIKKYSKKAKAHVNSCSHGLEFYSGQISGDQPLVLRRRALIILAESLATVGVAPVGKGGLLASTVLK